MKILLNNNSNDGKISVKKGQATPSLTFTSLPKILLHDKIILQPKKDYVYLVEFLQKLLTTLSKEDVNELNQLIKNLSEKFDEKRLPELLKLTTQKTNEMFSLIKKSGINTQGEGYSIKYSDEINKINTSTRGQIKKILIHQMATKEIVKKYKPHTRFMNNPTIGDWFKGFEKKLQMPNVVNSLFEHPVDKTLFLTGQYTDKELAIIKKKAISYADLPTEKIVTNKEDILIRMNKILDKPNQYVYGAFSNGELKKLKALSIDYDSFNDVLKQRNIFNKKAESIVFNANTKLSLSEIGENINGIGLVIQKSTVYDREIKQEIPCAIVLSKSQTMNKLKMLKIDKAFENNIIEFANRYKKLQGASEKQIAVFNEKANSLLIEEKNLLVSEVSFDVIGKKAAKSCIETIKTPLENDEILGIIDDENSNIFSTIQRFQNCDPKRYPNAGKKVVIPLLQLLFQNGCEPILVKALAFNSNHSPVGMYLKYGFKPISHNKAKIEDMIFNSPNGFDYKEPVWLHLPKESELREMILNQNPLKEMLELRKEY